MCEADEKFSQLVAFLTARRDADSTFKAIVYFSTCACASYFAKLLGATVATPAMPILTLHSKMSPKVRGWMVGWID